LLTNQPTNDELSEGLSDFWSVSFGEIQIKMEPIRTLPRTLIHILNHPVVASEIIVGSLVALLPIATDPSLYWLAVVTEIDDEILFHVHYYKLKDNVWKKMSTKSRGYCGTTQIHGILAANLTLIKKGGMRKNIEKRIQDSLNNI